MTWLGLIGRNLWRRPGRSVFTLLGVALAIASYLTLSGLSQGLTDGSQASLNERRIDLVVNRKGMIEVFGGSLPQDLEAKILAVPGVAGVSAELDTFLQIDESRHAVVSGWRAEDFQMAEMPMARGRAPRAGQGEVALGQDLAQSLKADIGSDVVLNFTHFRVCGVTGFTGGLLKGMAIIPMSDVQALLSRDGQVTLFQVRLKDPNNRQSMAAVRAAITALRPDLAVDTTEAALSASKMVTMLSAGSLAIAIVALAMACLSVLNTVAMAVEERTREIGILSLIGWSRGRILSMILSEGVLVAAAGGLLGLGLGYLGSRALAVLVLPGSGLSIPATLALEAKGEAAALLVGVLGALWPALRASRMTPAAAMQRQ